MTRGIFSTINNLTRIAYDRGYRVNKDGGVISPTGRNLRLKKSTYGYLYFHIRLGNKFRNIYCHKLCAFQKYGEIAFSADCIRHLDGNKENNSHSNVEIGTALENLLDIPIEQRSHRSAKYHNIDEIKSYYDKTGSYKQTMDMFNIPSKGTLHFILNKRLRQ